MIHRENFERKLWKWLGYTGISPFTEVLFKPAVYAFQVDRSHTGRLSLKFDWSNDEYLMILDFIPIKIPIMHKCRCSCLMLSNLIESYLQHLHIRESHTYFILHLHVDKYSRIGQRVLRYTAWTRLKIWLFKNMLKPELFKWCAATHCRMCKY